MPSFIKIGPVVLEKIFKWCRCVFAFSPLSPLEKECTNFNPLCPKMFLLPSLVEIALVVLEKTMKT